MFVLLNPLVAFVLIRTQWREETALLKDDNYDALCYELFLTFNQSKCESYCFKINRKYFRFEIKTKRKQCPQVQIIFIKLSLITKTFGQVFFFACNIRTLQPFWWPTFLHKSERLHRGVGVVTLKRATARVVLFTVLRDFKYRDCL